MLLQAIFNNYENNTHPENIDGYIIDNQYYNKAEVKDLVRSENIEFCVNNRTFNLSTNYCLFYGQYLRSKKYEGIDALYKLPSYRLFKSVPIILAHLEDEILMDDLKIKTKPLPRGIKEYTLYKGNKIVCKSIFLDKSFFIIVGTHKDYVSLRCERSKVTIKLNWKTFISSGMY